MRHGAGGRPIVSFGIVSVALLCAALGKTAASAEMEFHETVCVSAQRVVSAFYAELNAGKAKDMRRLADKGEAAASSLNSCARRAVANTRIENDRLLVRAADALFIAAEAHSRLRQVPEQVADLHSVMLLVTELDPDARASNEHLYQEARLLEYFSKKILGKVVR